MRFTDKYHWILKTAGFVFLLVLMVILNENQKSGKEGSKNIPQTVLNQEINDNGLAPVAVQIPRECEGMLPIRLISRTNSLFLLVVNQANEAINEREFILRKKIYIDICQKMNPGAWIQYLVSSGNKEIR
jgi:hypothetical protein